MQVLDLSGSFTVTSKHLLQNKKTVVATYLMQFNEMVL